MACLIQLCFIGEASSLVLEVGFEHNFFASSCEKIFGKIAPHSKQDDIIIIPFSLFFILFPLLFLSPYLTRSSVHSAASALWKDRGCDTRVGEIDNSKTLQLKMLKPLERGFTYVSTHAFVQGLVKLKNWIKTILDGFILWLEKLYWPVMCVLSFLSTELILRTS